MTISEILLQRANDRPEDTAFVYLEDRGRRPQRLTYRQLFERVTTVARFLLDQTGPQEPIGCVFRPGLDFIVAFFACLWSARIAVPVAPPRPRQDATDLAAILTHSSARFVLSNEQTIAGLKDADTDHRLLGRFNCVDVQHLGSEPGVAHCATASDIAFLQYTSGSTGIPKGVIVGNDNLLANSAQIATAFRHSRESVGVIWLPPHHDMGLVGGIIQPLFVGFPVYLMAPTDFIRSPFDWLNAISTYRATTSGGPNFAYEMCVSRISEERRADLDLSCWNIAFCGAEPVSIDTLRRFAQAFEGRGFRRSSFTPCYGLAEATLMVTCVAAGRSLTTSLPKRHSDRVNSRSGYVSCGRPQDGNTVTIVDEATGTPLEDGSEGEVWLRGPAIARGYWRDPDLTRSVFGAKTALPEATYLRTGDLGFLADGCLHISGRLRAMVVLRGVNHSLEDLENTSATAHASIIGAAAMAMVRTVDDAEQLFVMQEAAVSARREPARDDVVGRIRECIVARHGINPAGIVLVPLGSLPRTRSGKLRRHDDEATWSLYNSHAAESNAGPPQLHAR